MTSKIDALEMDRWLEQLDTTVGEVFETMLGMPCLPLSSDPEGDYGEYLKVTLSLSGEVQRNFCLYFTLTSARAAVIAFAGEDDIEWEPLVEDALGEIGNMVIGSLKTKLNLYVEPVRLSIPAISREQRIARLTAASGNSARDYRFLEHKLEIHMSFKAAADVQ